MDSKYIIWLQVLQVVHGLKPKCPALGPVLSTQGGKRATKPRYWLTWGDKRPYAIFLYA